MKKKKDHEYRKFGEPEIEQLRDVINSGELFYTKGKKTSRLCKRLASYFGAKHCVAASSGTAAIHAAIGALEIPPGKEVITTPITDFGTLIGLLYQNLIPVFADVNERTFNLDPEDVERKVNENTAAIIPVHLAGNPANMDEILKIARKNDLAVVEDCAQSYGAAIRGKKVGTFGNAGCYSLNAFKHISAGDGGFTITDDKELYEKVANFVDKSYDRLGTGRRMTTLAPCYRITELQSAVALAQLEKLDFIVKTRHELGDRFNRGIDKLDGIHTHLVEPGNYCSYWFTMFTIEETLCPRNEFAMALNSERVPAGAGYIEKPIYLEPVFRNKSFFPGGTWPAERVSGREYKYKPGDCPVAERVLSTAIRIPIEETRTREEIDSWVEAVKKVHEFYSTQ